jgi:excisionase family DNA binding protein
MSATESKLTDLLTIGEVAAILKLDVATLYRWRHEHKGPPAALIGRHLRYRRRDLNAWLDVQFSKDRKSVGPAL